jgi:hypothetical protein
MTSAGIRRREKLFLSPQEEFTFDFGADDDVAPAVTTPPDQLAADERGADADADAEAVAAPQEEEQAGGKQKGKKLSVGERLQVQALPTAADVDAAWGECDGSGAEFMALGKEHWAAFRDKHRTAVGAAMGTVRYTARAAAKAQRAAVAKRSRDDASSEEDADDD